MISLTNKQKEFWCNCTHRWNIKSGATRSGKTYLDYYLLPKRLRAVHGKEGLNVILGNTKSTLQRNIIEPLQDIWGTELVSDIKADNTAILFGEKVHCIGADKMSQVNRLRGSSIKYCYGDEVVTWSEDVFTMLKSRLDRPYSKFDGTCNPEGPNHWFKKFIDNPKIDIFAQNYTIYDNPFNSPEFVRNLEIEYQGTVYYDRYILGKWCRSSGIIFPRFANDATPWIISRDAVPKNFRWCEVGFDIGGNGSAYALTCSAEGPDGNLYTLKSQKIQPEEMNIDDIESKVTEFCEEVEQMYRVTIDIINSDHVDAIINSINDHTRYQCDKTYKPPLEDRPFTMTKLMSTHRIKFVEGQCDDLIDELQNLVFDDKSEKAIPLDDGTMQIDTWDSWTYSVSGRWSYLTI